LREWEWFIPQATNGGISNRGVAPDNFSCFNDLRALTMWHNTWYSEAKAKDFWILDFGFWIQPLIMPVRANP
jgi:hypothetical protein